MQQRFRRGSNGDCLALALSARGIEYFYLPSDRITSPIRRPNALIEFSIWGQTYYYSDDGRLFSHIPGGLVPGPSIDGPAWGLVVQKDLTKSVLRKRGVPVPEGISLPATALQQAEIFFEAFLPLASHGLCVKPAVGNKGHAVYVGIKDLRLFRSAFSAAGTECARVVIEESVPGVVHRFLVVAGRVVAIRYGRPASVDGNGVLTVPDLVLRKNAERQINPGHAPSPVQFGPRELAVLARQGLSYDYVPGPDERVFLGELSNVSAGADVIDVTDAVHPSYVHLVETLTKDVRGLVLCGVDVAIVDSSAPAGGGNCWILELNSGPGISGHHFPWEGQPRDVAGAIVDYLIERSAGDRQVSAPVSLAPAS